MALFRPCGGGSCFCGRARRGTVVVVGRRRPPSSLFAGRLPYHRGGGGKVVFGAPQQQIKRYVRSVKQSIVCLTLRRVRGRPNLGIVADRYHRVFSLLLVDVSTVTAQVHIEWRKVSKHGLRLELLLASLGRVKAKSSEGGAGYPYFVVAEISGAKLGGSALLTRSDEGGRTEQPSTHGTAFDASPSTTFRGGDVFISSLVRGKCGKRERRIVCELAALAGKRHYIVFLTLARGRCKREGYTSNQK
jgi:hypothetical protein